MARELRKATAKAVNAVGDIIESFADSYGINTQIEVIENLSEAEIKGTENMSLEEKGTMVSNLFNLMKRK